MAKNPVNHGRLWSEHDVNQLATLAKKNTPTRVIGLKMGRSESAIQKKASEERISLKPVNQSPYGPKKR